MSRNRRADHRNSPGTQGPGARKRLRLGTRDQHRHGRKEGLACGDWVLIHVGFAIAKMQENEAKASMEFLTGMGEAFTNELPPGWDEDDLKMNSKTKTDS